MLDINLLRNDIAMGKMIVSAQHGYGLYKVKKGRDDKYSVELSSATTELRDKFLAIVAKDEALRGPAAAGASDSAHKLAMIYEDAGQYLESAARQEKVLALRASTGGRDWYGMRTCASA